MKRLNELHNGDNCYIFNQRNNSISIALVISDDKTWNNNLSCIRTDAGNFVYDTRGSNVFAVQAYDNQNGFDNDLNCYADSVELKNELDKRRKECVEKMKALNELIDDVEVCEYAEKYTHKFVKVTRYYPDKETPHSVYWYVEECHIEGSKFRFDGDEYHCESKTLFEDKKVITYDKKSVYNYKFDIVTKEEVTDALTSEFNNIIADVNKH